MIVDGVIDIPETKDWDIGNGKPDAKISSAAVSFIWGLLSRHGISGVLIVLRC